MHDEDLPGCRARPVRCTFTCDEQLAALNLRYEVRVDPQRCETSDEQLEKEARERAACWLDEHGYGYRCLRTTITDMASIWRC